MKAAIIGLGNMGQKHYNILREFEDLDVCTVDPHSESSDYRTITDMLDSTCVDFAVISTPTSSHYENALQLIESGVSVLIEKPVFKDYLSIFQLQDLEAALERNSVKLAVGHIERFNPAIQALLKELEDKHIINCRFTRIGSYPKRITDVGVRMDLAVHDIDLVRFITGEEVLNCSSLESNIKGRNEDTATYFISTFGGSSATILCSWMSPIRERTIQVMTEHALYRVNLITQAVVKYFTEDGGLSFVATDIKFNKENALKNQLKQFIDYVNIGESGSLAKLHDGLAAMKYCI